MTSGKRPRGLSLQPRIHISSNRWLLLQQGQCCCLRTRLEPLQTGQLWQGLARGDQAETFFKSSYYNCVLQVSSFQILPQCSPCTQQKGIKCVPPPNLWFYLHIRTGFKGTLFAFNIQTISEVEFHNSATTADMKVDTKCVLYLLHERLEYLFCRNQSSA